MGEKAETARLSSFIGAMAVGDLVKSTLGPKGMDKILLGMGRNEGKVEVTNDGATILKNIGVDNPAAKVMVDMSRVQDAEVGDGTTSVVVFSSELIREAEKMIEMRIHPQTIVAGWRQATKVARQALESSAKDHGEDAEKFRNDLMNIARTTLSSKILNAHKDFFSKMAVDAVLRLKKSGCRRGLCDEASDDGLGAYHSRSTQASTTKRKRRSSSAPPLLRLICKIEKQNKSL